MQYPENLLRERLNLVYGTCLRVLGNAQDAADATQEVAMKWMQAQKHIHGSTNAWLHATAYKTAVDLIRARAAQRRAERQAAGIQVNLDEAEPDSQHDLRSHMDAALQELPTEQRSLILEHYLAGRGQTEMAQRRRTTQSRISRRLAAARDLLAAALARRGVAVGGAMLASALVSEAHAATCPPAVVARMAAQIPASVWSGGQTAATTAIGAKTWVATISVAAGVSLWVTAMTLVSDGSPSPSPPTEAVVATAPPQAYASVPTTAPPPVGGLPAGFAIAFTEDFEDTSFAMRGWYDNTSLITSLEGRRPSGARAAEFHWPKGSITPVSGGAARRLFPASEAVYVSYWVKYSSSYRGSNTSYVPAETMLLSDADGAWGGLARNHLAIYIKQAEGAPLLALQDGLNIDIAQIGKDLSGHTERRAIAGGNGVPLSEAATMVACYPKGDGIFLNNKEFRSDRLVFQDADGPYCKSDWHHIEVYVRLNRIVDGKGQGDGILRYWYDGQLLIERSTVMMRTAMHPGLKLNQFVIAPYIETGSPVDQTFWVDDLLVATEGDGTAGRP